MSYDHTSSKDQQISELKAENELLKKEIAELKLQVLSGVIKVCSGCKSLQSSSGEWIALDRYIELYTKATCSHGYCDSCAQKLLDDMTSSDAAG
ncbi:MAG: septum formation initiator family protein [Deltaproteobacteria bacterium]|jgi:hypothetical protein|nr:septum formation initiator family protein [Deltaproteobacteria bacterium]